MTQFKVRSEKFEIVFWVIISLGLLFIFSSFPMMKVRYDIWQHLGSIDSLVLHPEVRVFRSNWHSTWALIFRFFSIDSIYQYSVIIHRVQFILCCVIVYNASKLIYQALLVDNFLLNKNKWISSLSISSLMIWLTILGTESGFQQAWIMWYSVNYQITLPLLFLGLALSVNLLACKQDTGIIYIKSIQIIIIIVVIYLYHASELAYLVIYVPILCICFGLGLRKENAILIIVGALGFASILVYFYIDRVPELIKFALMGDYKRINELIFEYGAYNISGGNRFSANWNELYFFSFFLVIPIMLFAYYKPTLLNIKVLYFIAFSLIFCIIPNFIFSAGLVSLISYPGIVNRYYFASFIFVLVPLLSYLILDKFGKLKYPEIGVIITLSCIVIIFFLSKGLNNNGVYYQNIKSIKNSLDIKKVGIDITNDDIEFIGKQIQVAYLDHTFEEIIFCASYEKSYIVKYLYRQNNILFERRRPYSERECQEYAKKNKKMPIYIK